MQKHAVIIGAGVGGLAAACILAQAGYKVSIYEKNNQIGGRVGRIKARGFRFDMGPSWYLMPEVFEKFFSLLGENIDEYIEIEKLTPAYRVFFKDTLLGTIDITGDKRIDGKIFESLEPGSRAAYEAYLARASRNYQIAKDSYLYKNRSSWRDFLSWKAVGDFLQTRSYESMHTNTSRLFKNKEIQRILEFPALFLGSHPKHTPALFNLLNHVVLNQGVYYPKGGMYSLIEALGSLSKARGVRIRLNQEVSKILVKDGKANGVELAGKQKMGADLVISNADITHTEKKLLPREQRASSNRPRQALSPSALLIYLGVKGKYPTLRHHNLVFSKNWEANFDSLYRSRKWPKDPSFYVSNPSQTDRSLAPKNRELMTVLVPIPSGLRYTEEELEAFSDSILETMERTMHLDNLRKNIVYKQLFSVENFKKRYYSPQGSALGLIHDFRQTVMRPANAHSKIEGLYFVGANTYPGVGLPMCLISAQLLYKRLIGDNSSNPLSKID